MRGRRLGIPDLIVRVALLMLPSRSRDRYHVEFAAELWFVPRGARFVYAFRVLSRTWALRAALTSPSTTIGGAMPTRPLRCRLGRHEWTRRYNEEDRTPFEECVRCHETKGDRKSVPWIGG